MSLLHNDSIQLLPLWTVFGTMRAIVQEIALELGVSFIFGDISITLSFPLITLLLLALLSPIPFLLLTLIFL